MDGASLSGTANFSADALLSGGKQRPTIQWIGATPSQSGASSSAALSVPSLLRQLYASRESVIRANVHAAAAAAAGRSTSGYHFANGEGLSSAPGGGNGVGDYSTDVFPASSSHSYHSATNGIAASGNFLPDYLPAMTPPSSVSPRDAAAGALFAAEASLRHHSAYSSGLGGTDPSYGSNPAQPLALKSHHHVYGHGSVDHHHHGALNHHLNHHNSSGSHPHHPQYASVQPLVPADAGQFYSHAPSGFHLYHSQVSGKSPASAASANNSAAATWYPN